MAVHLKDRLRDMRDFLRAHRHDQRLPIRPRGRLSEVEGVIGRAVSVVDDTLTLAESVSHAVLPRPRIGAHDLRPLAGYFAPDPVEGETAFRRHMYRVAGRLAATQETDSPPMIRETFFTGAHAAVRRRHGHRLLVLRGAASAEARAAMAGVLAALLQEICRQALDGAPATPASRQACIRCFAPGLLASALLTADENVEPEDLLEIAALAIAARSERMARSLQADRPIADLAAIFDSLLTHLP
ncbi:hypothetical protein [Nitratireductor pacificus]|uniref:Uncharacterized protein n=1 Tax=Nitratireductor pacificus pht-3B TaxID=391937 RepID=K2N3B2_9HYPH|nr:hypothetical protein [Nitratireductor pacificus]EKF18703.1 hypothetical protein NA2_10985 [Nitratireductor pacificus pht-3B]